MARLYDTSGRATGIIRHPSPETAAECLADSASCARQLAQWRDSSQAKGPVQD
ncbi:hypothetical protein [Streptomyces sp. cg36]|uniref:hypothetical protein n=1 Tax=Streptomyces sp. cg36 TaxID=3238798 RepID=UPI0034E2065B